MSKIFISFLGATDYLPCNYEFQSKKIENVRFVQEATIRMNCMDWSKNDRVIIFTTQKALSLNWKDNGHKDQKTGEIFLCDGLETCIKKIKGPFSYHQVNIPDGKDEKQIWDIFIRVFDVIQENDEIIFDITHAFRSIPMLAVVILSYARIMKRVSLSGIYYGALETLGNINDARKMPPEKRIVPILDLTAFDRLMEWSVATDRFLVSGDASQVSRIAETSARSILSATKGNDRSQHQVRKLAKSLDQFTKTLSTCRGRNISHVVKRLKQRLEDCRQMEIKNVPLKTIMGKIEDQINQFKGHFISDGIQAARWCLEHNLIQQSYTILQETLITYFVYKIGEDPEDFSNKNLIRTLANQGASIYSENRSFEKWKKDAQRNRPTIEKFIHFYQTCPKLIETYNNLSGFRNDINHAGFSDQYKSAETFSRKMIEFLETVEKNIVIQ